ncbi:MAG: TatD family hydrolase [Elusimicrobiaceae bacterium]
MKIRYCDTHTHLTDPAFDADRSEVINRSFESGTDLLFETACVPDTWEPALKLCRDYPGRIYAVCGIHPQDCEHATPRTMARLLQTLQDPQVRAIGEIGLDYARYTLGPAEQKTAFASILKETASAGKPIVLHCRNPFEPGADAYADMFAIMREHWTPAAGRRFSGILHCFSGTENDAKTALGMGLLLGVNGTISYPKNSALREIIKKAGSANIVLETDCPYLPPQSRRGKRNDPSNIPEICRHTSQLLGLSERETAELTLKNALEIFGAG